ncbi:MAG: DUF642 domain-containing protein [Kiritimatiellae bacterium]|nr:DUF642 domain-containing protein [Kiritimatiellia bacterium]
MKKTMLLFGGILVGISGMADPFPVAAPACPAQVQVVAAGSAELIANGNFETDSNLGGRADYGYWSAGASTASWSGEGEVGLQKTNNNHPWCASICEGNHIVYLQRVSAISQTVTLPADGIYRLSFSFAARPTHTGHEVKVFLDERELVDIVSTSTAWAQKEVLFRASNGTYTLRFVGISREGIDDATTIDCVSLKAARQPAFGTLVANAGFEQGTTGIDGWKYFQTDTTVNYNQAAYAHTDVWVCSGDAGITQFGNSTWADMPFAGTYALFLQRNARAEQTITLPSDGLYRISFRATGRGGFSGHTVKVKLDDAVIGELYTDSRAWYAYEADFTAAAGEHVFAVEGVQNGDTDTASAVDEIVLTPLAAIENGSTRYDTLAHALEYGPQGQTSLAIVADSDLAQSLDLGTYAGVVTVANTTASTALVFPATIPNCTLSLGSVATLKVQLGAPADSQPVLNAITGLPGEGMVPIEISFASTAETSTYVLATSSLAETLATRLQPMVVGGVGHLEAADGRLIFVVEGLQYMLWHPSSGSDTWQTAAWLLNGTGDPTTFVNDLQAMFDGTDGQDTVRVDSDVQAREITITDGSYSFVGIGLISTPKVTKSGTGTLTMTGSGFSDVTAITLNAGTMKIGDDAPAHAVGAPGSSVTVKSGARFDLNYVLPENSGGNTAAGVARSAVTQNTRFIIEGAGPDGKGALYNGYAGSNWGFHLGSVVLVGDATIGSIGRVDLRPQDATTRASLTGGDEVTLTVKTAEPVGEMGFNIINADVAVGRIDVPDGGTIVFENGAATQVPGGIHLLGGRLGFWGSATPGVTADVCVDSNSTTFGSGNSYLRSNVTVAPNVFWTHQKGNLFHENGALTNNGIIRIESGILDLKSAPYVGAEDSYIDLVGGDVRVFPRGVEGQMTVNQSGGTSHFSNDADWSKAALSFSMTKGTVYWGSGESTQPVVDFEKISFNVDSGAVIFDTKEPYILPDAFKDTAFSSASIRAVGEEDVYTMGAFEWNIDELNFGTNDRFGYLDLEPGAALQVGSLRMGANSSPPKSTRVTLKAESSLNVTNMVRIGEWSGSTDTAKHEVIVAGGTFSSLVPAVVGYDSPFGYLTILSGEVDVPSLNPRGRLDYMPGYAQPTLTHEELVRQEGGLLKVGSGGLKDMGTTATMYAHVEHNLPNYVFQAGELRATDHWATDYCSAVLFGTRATAAGEEPFTVNPNGNTITFHTGLAGEANVTIAGTGSFVSDPDCQGIPAGKWTVATSTAVDLRGASGFAGGLELAPGTYASVANSATNLVEFGLFNLHTKDLATNDFWNARFPMLNTGMELMHTWRLNGQRSYHTYAYQGEFFVAPNEAGTWYFAGNFDDEIYLEIDGREVMYGTDWKAVTKGSADLSTGWHTFKAFGFDGAGEAGPQYRQTEWNSTSMGLGFRRGSDGGNASANYTRFDPAHLMMRPNSYLRLRRAAGSASMDAEAWDDRITYISPDRLQKKNTLRASRSAATCSTGSFLVEPDKAGVWTFTGQCDDNVRLVVDGEKVLETSAWTEAKTGSVTLTPGWHAVEIRTFDGSGGWGGQLTDAAGKTCILKVQLPGMESADEAIAFQNPEFRFAPTADGSDVRAGLGGVSKVSAGATLESTGLAPYPIYGTLEGAGTLSGAFRFVGGASRLSVKGQGVSSVVDVVDFQNPDPQALADLGGVKALFAERPSSPRYVLSSQALGLTDERACTLPVEVFDESGKDYSANFKVRVQGGQVVLSNAKAFGIHIFLR